MMLGEKIHQLRKGKSMSQEELASQLTVSRQAISKWELGESVPDTENVVQLSKLFSVSTDYLLSDEYDSDTDIPAVKASSENLKTEYRSKTKKVSYILISIGLLGILTMWILSCAIPAQKMVPDSLGAPMEWVLDEPGNGGETDDGLQWYTSREVRGDLGAFVETYSLIPMLTLCCALVLVGVILILLTRKRERLQKTSP